MARILNTEEFFQVADSWQNHTPDPNAGTGTARGVGSVYVRDGNYQTRPNELYYKLGSAAKAWSKQNLLNLNVYNVTLAPYNCVADGTTDCGPGIRQAVSDAAAAGGGIIYFPAAVLGYSVNINAVGHNGIVEVTNKSNLVFMGDGYNSWLKMNGDFAGRFQVLFLVNDRSQRIVFYNLRMNGQSFINPAASSQNHLIQVSTDVPDVGPPHDIEIVQCWFDPVIGDGVRHVGQAGFGGNRVTDTRTRFCMFNMADATRSRSCISVQRNVQQVQIQHNWMGPVGLAQLGQQIDFEPAAGDGPTEFDICHNIFDCTNDLSVTLSGVDTTHPSSRVCFSYNIIVGDGNFGGGVEAVFNPTEFVIQGNIVHMGTATTTGFSVLEMRNSQQCVILENIFESKAAASTRAAIKIFEDSGSQPLQCVIADNICYAVAAATNIAGIQFQATNQFVLTRNMVFVDCGTSTATVGIQFRSTTFVGQDWACNDNLVLSTSAQRFSTGINWNTTGGNDVHNILCNLNMVQNATNGITYDATHNYLDFRACNDNNLTTCTNQAVVPPSTNVGVTHESTAGPNPQMILLTLAAGPAGVVTAKPGSLVNNISGAAATILFYKESGTGTAGWISDGASEIEFGMLSGSVATGARFFAPGFALATEGTVEIQMPIPRAGNIRNIRVHCTAGVGGGNNTYRVRKNGVDTTVLIAMANTATTANGTNSVLFAAGDLLSMSDAKTLAPGTPQTNVVVTVELTS